MPLEFMSLKHSMLLLAVECAEKLRHAQYANIEDQALARDWQNAAAAMVFDLGGLAARW